MLASIAIGGKTMENWMSWGAGKTIWMNTKCRNF